MSIEERIVKAANAANMTVEDYLRAEGFKNIRDKFIRSLDDLVGLERFLMKAELL